MVYVALLRGINVGGNAKVEMPRLKTVFESLGCTDVRTYINSGNVIFGDKRSAKELEPLIEKAIAKEFGLEIRVILRDAANIRKLCTEIPKEWTNGPATNQKTDVMFLWDEINDKSILTKVKINPDIENVRYIDGALVWNIARDNATRSGAHKLIGTDLYRHMTLRNINTVRKLHELMLML